MLQPQATLPLRPVTAAVTHLTHRPPQARDLTKAVLPPPGTQDMVDPEVWDSFSAALTADAQ
jgi:hypothetical protein